MRQTNRHARPREECRPLNRWPDRPERSCDDGGCPVEERPPSEIDPPWLNAEEIFEPENE
jgi:hypothetical protein